MIGPEAPVLEEGPPEKEGKKESYVQEGSDP